MANEIRLPDIGDFKDVPIIEILVAPGQSVRKDETLLTLESDKASMDVPAPEDGVIGEIRVKVGDKVTQGDVLATYSGGERHKAGCCAGDAQSRRRPLMPEAVASKSRSPLQRPPRPQVRRRSRRLTLAGRPISRPISWFWGPVPAATPPPSAPPIWGRTSFWSMRDRRSAASVSTSAASRRRRCCMSPRSSTTPRRWVRTA